jgi:hypothetical protein
LDVPPVESIIVRAPDVCEVQTSARQRNQSQSLTTSSSATMLATLAFRELRARQPGGCTQRAQLLQIDEFTASTKVARKTLQYSRKVLHDLSSNGLAKSFCSNNRSLACDLLITTADEVAHRVIVRRFRPESSSAMALFNCATCLPFFPPPFNE